MALSVVQKNANYRINHADFRDVGQINYALGTISDVQTLQADPIVPTSLVKVTGNWGESDWIPLFYTPKKSYWDICPDWLTLYKSQDLNPDALTSQNVADFYYKTAWTSFRPGDQVKVMLQAPAGGGDLVPVAVLGFGDGVPRIGENIIKFDCQGLDQIPSSETFYKAAFGLGLYEGPGTSYADGDTGPDGLDLKLTEEYPMITGGTTTSPTVTYWRLVGSWSPYGGYNPKKSVGDYAAGVFLYAAGLPYNNSPSEVLWWLDFYIKGKAQINTTQVSMGPIPVGPVDFILNGSYNLPGPDAEVDQEIYYYLMTSAGGAPAYPVYPNFPPDPRYPQDAISVPDPSTFGPGWNSLVDNPPPTSAPPGFGGGIYFNPVFDTDPLSWPVVNGTYGLAGSIPYSAYKGSLGGPGVPSSDYTFDYDYTDPVLGPAVLACTIGAWALPPVNPTGPFDTYPVFDTMKASIHGKPPVIQSSGPFFSSVGPLLPSVGSIKAYVRPHTKAELQAADMWPPGLS